MKKLILSVSIIGLLGASLLQAKWQAFPYKNKFYQFFRLSVGGPESIWVVANVKGEPGRHITSLYKWNGAKGAFEVQNIPFSDRQKIYAFDKGVFILSPKKMDQRTKEFNLDVSKKISLFAKQELEKLVKAKEVPQGVVDRFDKEIKENPEVGLMSIFVDQFIYQVYPEAKEKKVFDAIMKVGEAANKKEQELIKGFVPSFTRPLMRFMNGKLETIRDLGNLKVVGVGAVKADDVLVFVNDKPLNHFIERWNGKEWKKMGERKIYPRSYAGFRAGKDGSVFVNTLREGLLKWDGSSWTKAPVDFVKIEIEDFSVVNANDIWFSSEERNPPLATTPYTPVPATPISSLPATTPPPPPPAPALPPPYAPLTRQKFFHWDGKKLEQRGSFEKFKTSITAAPGIVLIRDYGNKIYRWVEEPKKVG